MTDKGKICFAQTIPTKRAPASIKREKSKLFVTFRPSESIKDEISLTSGHDYKSSTVTASSGKKRYSFPLQSCAEHYFCEFLLCSSSSPSDRLRLEFDVDLSRTELSPADLLRALFVSVPSIDLDLDLPRVTGLRDFFVFDLPRGDLFAGSPD